MFTVDHVQGSIGARSCGKLGSVLRVMAKTLFIGGNSSPVSQVVYEILTASYKAINLKNLCLKTLAYILFTPYLDLHSRKAPIYFLALRASLLSRIRSIFSAGVC